MVFIMNGEKMKTIEFTHLHSHTEYSLLDSMNKIKDYVKKIKDSNMSAGAITDHGVMYGVIDFYKCAKAEGIKPIIGCEVYVSPKSRLEKDTDNRYSHLVLLAETNEGYDNLMKICSHGFIDGFYYKPRVDFEILKLYHKGIIALSACLGGSLPKAIIEKDEEGIAHIITDHIEIFGKNNYFLELQDHGIFEQQIVNAKLIELSKSYDIPLVATNDCHYTEKEHAIAHEVLLCMQCGKTISDPTHMKYDGNEYYVKTPQEMYDLFSYIPEAIENTMKIAERCNVEIEFHVTKMPTYEVPSPHTSVSYLHKLCLDGLKKRYPTTYDNHLERLEYELSIIVKMGYVDYFLIVWDFINWARIHDIAVGPGRGSAAGSLVSYSIGITDVDPIQYQLLFERFLNPERVSMPDIDIDFCYERREEVIEYVKEKYGHNCVAQIITFGTMAARMVIKDVGKVMDIPYSVCDTLAKMIPVEVGITIEKALELNPDFNMLYNTDEKTREIIDMCICLEGLPRQTSTHAAGIVICGQQVMDFLPLARTGGEGNNLVSQFGMNTVEELGLLKMDFLGLKTLTVIEDTVKNVQLSKHEIINIKKIDYEDTNILDFIGTGNTDGVFQLESDGMKNFMSQLKPKSLEDLIAGISLYRPGPMDFIPQYINGKNSPYEIQNACPELDSILTPTYGCIVYQEQVMQIVRDLAGYTLGRSDLVRRAMSKKKASVMEEERLNFVYGNEKEKIPGCINRGIKEEVATEIFDTMTDFAKYAFNKSHAASYAIIAYQTAWLKYYYPKEYMAALMSSVMTVPSKLLGYIRSCKDNNITILPPNLIKSSHRFIVNEDAILFALPGIKNISENLARTITQKREGSVLENIEDVIEFLVSCDANKKAILNLIKAGALDDFGGNRAQYQKIYENIIDKSLDKKNNNVIGQLSLFDNEEIEKQFILPRVNELPLNELLEQEKEVLGFFLSGHPLQEYEQIIKSYSTHSSFQFVRQDDESFVVEDGQSTTICGIIEQIDIKYTKKSGKPMAFFTLEDQYGSATVIVFPQQLQHYKELLQKAAKVVVSGTISLDESRNATIICDKIKSMNDIPHHVWIKFPTMANYKENSDWIDLLLCNNQNDTLIVYIEETKIKKLFKNAFNLSESSLQVLKERFGDKNIAITV